MFTPNLFLKPYFKCFAIIFLSAFTLLISNIVFAKEQSLNLLTNDVLSVQSLVIFEKCSGRADSINKLHIHYLQSEDCQSGYAQRYDTPANAAPFLIKQATPFALSSTSVYQAGVHMFGSDKIEQMHSILINLIDNHDQQAKFIGSCSDQQTNCCVSVICSNDTGTCQAQHDIGTQLFVEYIPPHREEPLK